MSKPTTCTKADLEVDRPVSSEQQPPPTRFAVLTQTLASSAVLQKDFPTATKARVERALGETGGDIDEARELLRACFFTGDKLIVTGEG